MSAPAASTNTLVAALELVVMIYGNTVLQPGSEGYEELHATAAAVSAELHLTPAEAAKALADHTSARWMARWCGQDVDAAPAPPQGLLLAHSETLRLPLLVYAVWQNPLGTLWADAIDLDGCWTRRPVDELYWPNEPDMRRLMRLSRPARSGPPERPAWLSNL